MSRLVLVPVSHHLSTLTSLESSKSEKLKAVAALDQLVTSPLINRALHRCPTYQHPNDPTWVTIVHAVLAFGMSDKTKSSQKTFQSLYVIIAASDPFRNRMKLCFRRLCMVALVSCIQRIVEVCIDGAEGDCAQQMASIVKKLFATKRYVEAIRNGELIPKTFALCEKIIENMGPNRSLWISVLCSITIFEPTVIFPKSCTYFEILLKTLIDKMDSTKLAFLYDFSGSILQVFESDLVTYLDYYRTLFPIICSFIQIYRNVLNSKSNSIFLRLILLGARTNYFIEWDVSERWISDWVVERAEVCILAPDRFEFDVDSLSLISLYFESSRKVSFTQFNNLLEKLFVANTSFVWHFLWIGGRRAPFLLTSNVIKNILIVIEAFLTRKMYDSQSVGSVSWIFIVLSSLAYCTQYWQAQGVIDQELQLKLWPSIAVILSNHKILAQNSEFNQSSEDKLLSNLLFYTLGVITDCKVVVGAALYRLQTSIATSDYFKTRNSYVLENQFFLRLFIILLKSADFKSLVVKTLGCNNASTISNFDLVLAILNWIFSFFSDNKVEFLEFNFPLKDFLNYPSTYCRKLDRFCDKFFGLNKFAILPLDIDKNLTEVDKFPFPSQVLVSLIESLYFEIKEISVCELDVLFFSFISQYYETNIADNATLCNKYDFFPVELHVSTKQDHSCVVENVSMDILLKISKESESFRTNYIIYICDKIKEMLKVLNEFNIVSLIETICQDSCFNSTLLVDNPKMKSFLKYLRGSFFAFNCLLNMFSSSSNSWNIMLPLFNESLKHVITVFTCLFLLWETAANIFRSEDLDSTVGVKNKHAIESLIFSFNFSFKSSLEASSSEFFCRLVICLMENKFPELLDYFKESYLKISSYVHLVSNFLLIGLNLLQEYSFDDEIFCVTTVSIINCAAFIESKSGYGILINDVLKNNFFESFLGKDLSLLRSIIDSFSEINKSSCSVLTKRKLVNISEYSLDDDEPSSVNVSISTIDTFFASDTATHLLQRFIISNICSLDPPNFVSFGYSEDEEEEARYLFLKLLFIRLCDLLFDLAESKNETFVDVVIIERILHIWKHVCLSMEEIGLVCSKNTFWSKLELKLCTSLVSVVRLGALSFEALSIMLECANLSGDIGLPDIKSILTYIVEPSLADDFVAKFSSIPKIIKQLNYSKKIPHFAIFRKSIIQFKEFLIKSFIPIHSSLQLFEFFLQRFIDYFRKKSLGEIVGYVKWMYIFSIFVSFPNCTNDLISLEDCFTFTPNILLAISDCMACNNHNLKISTSFLLISSFVLENQEIEKNRDSISLEETFFSCIPWFLLNWKSFAALSKKVSTFEDFIEKIGSVFPFNIFLTNLKPNKFNREMHILDSVGLFLYVYNGRDVELEILKLHGKFVIALLCLLREHSVACKNPVLQNSIENSLSRFQKMWGSKKEFKLFVADNIHKIIVDIYASGIHFNSYKVLLDEFSSNAVNLSIISQCVNCCIKLSGLDIPICDVIVGKSCSNFLQIIIYLRETFHTFGLNIKLRVLLVLKDLATVVFSNSHLHVLKSRYIISFFLDVFLKYKMEIFTPLAVSTFCEILHLVIASNSIVRFLFFIITIDEFGNNYFLLDVVTSILLALNVVLNFENDLAPTNDDQSSLLLKLKRVFGLLVQNENQAVVKIMDSFSIFFPDVLVSSFKCNKYKGLDFVSKFVDFWSETSLVKALDVNAFNACDECFSFLLLSSLKSLKSNLSLIRAQLDTLFYEHENYISSRESKIIGRLFGFLLRVSVFEKATFGATVFDSKVQDYICACLGEIQFDKLSQLKYLKHSLDPIWSYVDVNKIDFLIYGFSFLHLVFLKYFSESLFDMDFRIVSCSLEALKSSFKIYDHDSLKLAESFISREVFAAFSNTLYKGKSNILEKIPKSINFRLEIKCLTDFIPFVYELLNFIGPDGIFSNFGELLNLKTRLIFESWTYILVCALKITSLPAIEKDQFIISIATLIVNSLKVSNDLNLISLLLRSVYHIWSYNVRLFDLFLRGKHSTLFHESTNLFLNSFSFDFLSKIAIEKCHDSNLAALFFEIFVKKYCNNSLQNVSGVLNSLIKENNSIEMGSYFGEMHSLAASIYCSIDDLDSIHGVDFIFPKYSGLEQSSISLSDLTIFTHEKQWSDILQSTDLYVDSLQGSKIAANAQSQIIASLKNLNCSRLLFSFVNDENHLNKTSLNVFYEALRESMLWSFDDTKILLNSDATDSSFEKLIFDACKCFLDSKFSYLREIIQRGRLILQTNNLPVFYNFSDLLTTIVNFRVLNILENGDLGLEAKSLKKLDTETVDNFEYLELQYFIRNLISSKNANSNESFAMNNILLARIYRESGLNNKCKNLLNQAISLSSCDSSKLVKFSAEFEKNVLILDDFVVSTLSSKHNSAIAGIKTLMQNIPDDHNFMELKLLCHETLAKFGVRSGSSSTDEIINHFEIASQISCKFCVSHSARIFKDMGIFQNKLVSSMELKRISAEWRHFSNLVFKRKSDIIALENAMKKFDKSQSEYKKLFVQKEATMKEYLLDFKTFSSLDENIKILAVSSVNNLFNCLQCSDLYDTAAVNQLIALWFGYCGNSNPESLLIPEINALFIEKSIGFIGKFVPMRHQIASRLDSFSLSVQLMDLSPKEYFSGAIFTLLESMLTKFPHHCFYTLFSLTKADQLRKKQSQAVSTVSQNKLAQAKRLLLSGAKHHLKLYQANRKFVESLIELSKENDFVGKPKDALKPFSCKEKFKFSDIELLSVPTLNLPSASKNYEINLVTICYMVDTVKIAATGLSRPLILECICSNGETAQILLKPKDDLRQDAVMQQVFNLSNQLFNESKITRKRSLRIRTYNVVPLTPDIGLVEWVPNSQALGDILQELHTNYCKTDWSMSKIFDYFINDSSPRLQKFKIVCANCTPILHMHFIINFLNPSDWLAARTLFSRSVAAASMVGYVVGLGDRHVGNILLDVKNGELIHIDLGIGFDQGKFMTQPELVPFRLTRDIVDGMGIMGIEGVFRKSCEYSLQILRENVDMLVCIVRVFSYDPLYKWTIAVDAIDQVESDMENNHAQRAILRLQRRLRGFVEEEPLNVQGQVSCIINEAMNVENLCNMFHGWKPWL